MASLVDQIFMQAQAGSAQGQGFGEFFFEGKRLNQRQQQLDMQRKQLNAEMAMMPLKQTLMQQDASRGEIEIKNLLTQRQNYLEGQSALSTLDEGINQRLATGDDIGAFRMHAQAGLSDKRLLSSPEYQAMGKQLEALTQEASLAQSRLKAAELAEARAETMGLQVQLAQQRVDVSRMNAETARQSLELRLKQAEERIPPAQLAAYKTKLSAILSDITLIGQPEAMEQKIDELEREFTGRPGQFTPAPAPAAAPATRLRWTPNGLVPVQ